MAACLVLVVLVAVVWVKWSGSRRDAARLEKELTRVYKEAEDLRLQAALAHERIAKLERDIRALRAERERQAQPPEEKPKGAKPPARR
jgi:predicted  nucleic acid-binding Zn-ribbon protein